VTTCAITGPSGHTELDARACQLLPKRARFDPARDTSGAAVNGNYGGTISWRLPPEE
jgi:periplasmic protein TonB